MRALDRGGVLAVAGIHLTDTPSMNYEHELFYKTGLRSVTSNTRDNGREFLALAVRYHVRATTHLYPMSQAQQALQDLKAGVFRRSGCSRQRPGHRAMTPRTFSRYSTARSMEAQWSVPVRQP
jgi:D-arabinose 1-dehydrogenase-like Zn-dependent alcohol dehydrogenase